MCYKSCGSDQDWKSVFGVINPISVSPDCGSCWHGCAPPFFLKVSLHFHYSTYWCTDFFHSHDHSSFLSFTTENIFFSHPLNDSVPKGSHLCTFLYILTLCRKCQPCWWHEKGQVTPRPRAPASVLLPLFVLYFQLSKGIFTSNSTSAEHPFSYFLLVSCVHMAAQDRSLRVCWASSQPKTRSSWPLLSPHSHAQVRPSTFFSGAQQLLPHWFSYTQPLPISKFICP